MSHIIQSLSLRSSQASNWSRNETGPSRAEDDTDAQSTMAGEEDYDEEIERIDAGSSATGAPGMWELMTNRGILVDDTLQWLKLYTEGAGANAQICRSFHNMRNVAFDPRAPIPDVGLVFLPGVDKPTVARLEQHNMVDKVLDQRDANWRVNTAGSLIESWTVGKDMIINVRDGTKTILDRMDQSRARIAEHVDKVTIDSEKVTVVHGLRDPQTNKLKYHLAATLVEVDTGSLAKLLSHFHNLVNNSRPDMGIRHHAKHLDAMIESARFFYSRSPIFFRMSTRPYIIHAIDIRYGIDDAEQGFRTTYNSKGIQQLISVSAGYYNSLDPSGTSPEDKQLHALVRARFLQMLVILLSMLTPAGLTEESEFLLRTYGIGADDRSHLELLFLKVIPLSSINARVFLKSLCSAVFNFIPSPQALDDEEGIWYYVLHRLAYLGYLVPSTVESLSAADKRYSWMPAWPSEGIHSSHVFGRLQLHGKQLKGFNEILPVRITTDADVSQLTVYLYNSDQAYVVDLHDYEDIQAMKPGHYNLSEVENPDRVLELHIRQESLNNNVNKAIYLLNDIIARIASNARRSSGKLTKSLFSRHDLQTVMVANDLPNQAAITRHESVLGDATTYMAVGWKCDGKSINKMDMLNRMTRSSNRIRAVLRSYEKYTNGYFSSRNVHHQQILTLLSNHDEQIRIERTTPRVAARQPTPDSPIRRTIYPNDDLQRVDHSIWYEYKSGIQDLGSQDDILYIESERDMVASVVWNYGEAKATVELARLQTRFIVSPIQPAAEAEQDIQDHLSVEVEHGDVVLLCGRYMVVVTASPDPPPPVCRGEQAYTMTNWMEILKVDTQVRRRRRENQVKAGRYTSFIR